LSHAPCDPRFRLRFLLGSDRDRLNCVFDPRHSQSGAHEMDGVSIGEARHEVTQRTPRSGFADVRAEIASQMRDHVKLMFVF